MAEIKELLDDIESTVRRAPGMPPLWFYNRAIADAPRLVAALRAVLDGHGRRPCKGCTDEAACPGICVKCGSLYPCADVRAITDALVKSDG